MPLILEYFEMFFPQFLLFAKWLIFTEADDQLFFKRSFLGRFGVCGSLIFNLIHELKIQEAKLNGFLEKNKQKQYIYNI